MQVKPLVARLLAARGLLTAAQAQFFLRPVLSSIHDALLLKDMDVALERLARAIREDEKIAIFGDYDVDGLTATALLTRFFKWLGIEAIPYIPDRLNEGYGMSREGVDLLHERGVSLIVTVDNGISCHREIDHARSLDIDVVVTDHHRPCETLPQAVAVVDPHRADCEYPFKGLSGVGVAFKLAHGLARFLDKPAPEARAFLKSVMDLVALGTVADVMSLLGENRPLVAYGLDALRQTANPGLAAMSEMLGVDPQKPITSEQVAFLFAPRLNAAGRTGNAHDALELLLTDDRQRAWELAKHLDRLNNDRRRFENEVLDMAMSQIEDEPELLDDPVLVVAGEQWHQGVVGIVASRLVDRFGKPAIVLGIDDQDAQCAKGSARSIPGFDVHQALAASAACLHEFGGHKMAAGVTLPLANLASFRAALSDYVRKNVRPEDLVPRLELDGIADLAELSFDALDQIDLMRPFGQDNHAPLIGLMRCRLANGEPPQEIGGNHLKLRLVQTPDIPPKGRPPRPLTAMWFYYPSPTRPCATCSETPNPSMSPAAFASTHGTAASLSNSRSKTSVFQRNPEILPHLTWLRSCISFLSRTRFTSIRSR